MNALQSKLFEMLLEIDGICRRHGITYYLAGGSVIGALRHKGFIPWDDDIDIAMTRPEFDRFMAIIDDELRPDRELVSSRRGVHHKITVKYMRKDTCCVFKSQILDFETGGLAIDIMTLQPIPAGGKDAYLHDWHLYNELLTDAFVVNAGVVPYLGDYRRERGLMDERGLASGQDAGMAPGAGGAGRNEVTEAYYRKLYCDPVPEFDEYIYGWGEIRYIYGRAMFEEPLMAEFEGTMLPLPTLAYEYCAQTYGDDWYYIPKADGQETHSTQVNVNLSYGNLFADYRPFLDEAALRRSFIRRKRAWMERLPFEESKRRSAHLAEAAFATCQYRHYVENEAERLEALWAAGDFAGYLELMDPFVGVQLSPGLRKNAFYLDAGDPTLARLATALCHAGRYGDAQRILRVREAAARVRGEDLGEAGAELRTALALVALSARMARALVRGPEPVSGTPEGRPAAAQGAGAEGACLQQAAAAEGSFGCGCTFSDVRDALLDAHPGLAETHADFHRARIARAAESLPAQDAAWEQLEAAAVRFCERYPENGELLKSYGDALHAQGREDQAQAAYGRALMIDRNGYDVMDIARKRG